MKVNKGTVKMIVAIVVLVCVGAVLYFSFPAILRFLGYIINLFLPFILGFAFAAVARPILNFLNKKLRLPKGLSAILVMIIIIGVLGSIVGFVIYEIISEIRNLYYQFPTIYQNFCLDIESFKNTFNGIFGSLPVNIQETISALFSEISDNMTEFINEKSVPFVASAGTIAKALPRVLIACIVFLLSTFFMMCDFEFVSRNIGKVFKGFSNEKLEKLKAEVKNYLGGYVKAQGILMSITFFIMLISFNILSVSYGLLIALAVAFLDALPFFGSGAVLWPWTIISFITGNVHLGVGLLITYVVIILTRQFIEPKIVSKNIGMHPLLTLISMYVGYKTLSIGGMILGPVILMLIISFYRAGLFDKAINVLKATFRLIKKELISATNYIKRKWESGE